MPVLRQTSASPAADSAAPNTPGVIAPARAGSERPALVDLAAHPWEGPNGHLWLRDLFLMLRADGQDATEIEYALGKPWKYALQVEQFRDRKNEEASRD